MAEWSGASTGKMAELQPLTIYFRIGNVKRKPDIGKRCQETLELAYQNGVLPVFYGLGVSFLFTPDEVYIHAIRVPAYAADPADLTRAEMQKRIDAWTMFEYWKRDVSGFEDACFLSNSPYIGVRETRRIVGQSTSRKMIFWPTKNLMMP